MLEIENILINFQNMMEAFRIEMERKVQHLQANILCGDFLFRSYFMFCRHQTNFKMLFRF